MKCPFRIRHGIRSVRRQRAFPRAERRIDPVLPAKTVSTPNGIAVACISRHPAGIQPLLGSMTPERIRQMAAGADIELERRDWWSLYQAARNPLV